MICPCSSASHRAIGIVAEEVLPYFSILIIALCQHANDFSDSDPGSGVTMEESLTINTGNHSSQPKLSVTTADPIPNTLKLKSGLIQLKNGIIRI